jgi:hypothetical protein
MSIKRYFKVRRSGQGGFMNPPGDPAHVFSVWEYKGPRMTGEPIGMYSIDGLTEDDVPEMILVEVQAILEKAKRVCSDLWVRNVYGYFRNMWTADGQPWTSADQLISGRPDGAPDEYHAAVVFVRKWFPDHEPQVDLIRDPGHGYGSWPCIKCGTREQYEARKDALCVVHTGTWNYNADCPGGGRHEV